MKTKNHYKRGKQPIFKPLLFRKKNFPSIMAGINLALAQIQTKFLWGSLVRFQDILHQR
jgi:hypothetical protein